MPNQVFLRLPYAYANLISNQNVQATYTVAPDCRTVTLRAKTYIKGTSLAFNWKFGDGDSTIQNVAGGGDTTYATLVHTYPPGRDTFFASLAVTSDTVCGIGRAGAKVVVKPPPPAANFRFAVGDCGSSSVQFTDSSLLNFNPSLTYQWAYRAAATAGGFTDFSAAPNPLFSFPALDSFEVRLIVSSSLSCVPGNSIVKRVYLKAKPRATFTVAAPCGSLYAAFNSTSTVATGTVQSYFWDAGDGQTSALENPRFTYADYGSKTVKLAVTASNGCASDTLSATVQIKDKPQATLAYDNNACAAVSFNVTAGNILSGAPIASHQWLLNDDPVANNTSVLSLALPAGSYVVKYLSLSTTGCASDTAIKNIVVDALPVVSFTTADTCAGSAIRLQNQATGNIVSYNWYFGNGDSSLAKEPTYNYPAAGDYTIRLVAATANNCTATALQTINIKASPVAAFSVKESCPGKTLGIVNSSSGSISSYMWQANDGQNFAGSSPVISFAREGNYTLQLKVEDAFGCSDSSRKSLAINAVKITATADTAILVSQPLQLTAGGAAGYLWQPATYLNSAGSENPVFKSANSGVYPIQVEGTTAQGCKGTAAIKITVYNAKAGLLLPTAFSPNGDNLNDVFRLNCARLQSLRYFRIVNRYGQAVYEQRSCSNNQGWNGTCKGAMQPPGAYIYDWQGVSFEGKQLKGNGTVVLVR